MAAASKTFRVSTLRLCESRKGLLGEVIVLHKVGGWFITLHEKQLLESVGRFKMDPKYLPCRIPQTAAYFVDPSISEEEDHIMCRSSFNIEERDLKEITDRYSLRGPPHFEANTPPIFHFLDDLMKYSEIRSEDWILKNCFTIPFCFEHEPCKIIHAADGSFKPIHSML